MARGLAGFFGVLPATRKGLKMSKKRPSVMCDYCSGPTEFVPDSQVYRQSYGSNVYLCRPCGAWVGVHRGGRIPLGRLAKPELRKLKIAAHAEFDVLWRAAMRHRGWSRSQARNAAYGWLAASMGIDRAHCHIGMFDEDQCRLVIDVCKSRKPVRKTDEVC
jgi:hypothetical protein